MSNPSRYLAAAAAATLLAAPAFAQYGQPGQYPAQQVQQPAQVPPPGYQAPPPAPPVAQQPLPPAPPPKRLQLALTWGWQVNGDVDGYYGKLKIDDASSIGLSIQYALRPGSRLELLWLTSNTTAKIDSYTVSFASTRPFTVGVNYFQLGAVQGFRRGAFEPFGGATLGAVWYSPSKIEEVTGASYYASDTWRFAFTLGGGANVFLSPALALRLHARLLVPVYFAGGGFYVGTGGSGATVNAGIPAVAGDFGVGLVYAH
jgi:opacity protein-like surface antigen